MDLNPQNDIALDPRMNADLYRLIHEARSGDTLEKVASAGSLYVRRHFKEGGISRRIIDFKTATDADLVTLPGQEMPCMWGSLENESPGAVSITFKDSVDTEFFWRTDFILRFFIVSSPEFTKNTFELKTHQHDTVKQITEDAMFHLQDEEDRRVFSEVDTIVGAAGANGMAGYVQHLYAGEFSRDTFADSQYLFTDHKIPGGINVVNHRFIAHFQKMDRTEAGGDIAQDLLFKGKEAIADGKLGGIPHLFTTKNHIVANNVQYQFAQQDYLGHAREFQPPTLWTEKKIRQINFRIDEIIAVSLPHYGAMRKVVFENVPS